MKIKILASLLAFGAVLFTSCLEQEATVTLNKDGSGTIVEETVYGKDMVDMMEMAAMQAGGKGGAQKNPLGDLMSEEKAKAKAAKFGEGVEFVKVEAVSRNGGKGALATYKFADINKITLNPSDVLSDMGDKGGVVKKGNNVKINYADGKLTLTMPEPEQENVDKVKAAELPDEAQDPQAAMAMQMMRGMKITSNIVFPSGIAETNATYHDKNSITLMALDFGKIMDNPEGLKVFKKLDLKDRAASQEQLKGIDGAKVETQKEVTVTLK